MRSLKELIYSKSNTGAFKSSKLRTTSSPPLSNDLLSLSISSRVAGFSELWYSWTDVFRCCVLCYFIDFFVSSVTVKVHL